MDSKYVFELYTPDGQLLADISNLARQRRVTMSRNEAEEIQFKLDLALFEAYAQSINMAPSQLLVVDRTEVRVRRGANYLCGGQVVYAEPDFDERDVSLDVRATGFLNLFADRYTAEERIFAATEATTIAATLLTETQGRGAAWDFGVTIGSLATVGTHDRTYQRTNIKDALQNLTRVQVAPFDFAFTPDKVFNTYSSIGSVRPEIRFEFPGNIRRGRVPIDGTAPANFIHLYGQGTGEEAGVYTTVEDASAQSIYKVRERKLTLSDVNTLETLADHGEAELAAWAHPFVLPILEVAGNRPPFVTDYTIGDYVTVAIRGYEYLSEVNGLYRIEKIDLTISDDDDELVRLSVSR